MIRWAVPLMLLLAGCGAPKAVVSPEFAVPLRNPATPVASQANVTMARLLGHWQVVQSSRSPAHVPVVIGENGMQFGSVALPLREVAQGRYVWGEGKLWVHWLDADNRTVAMGDPEGSWFAILDRSGKPGERLSAAREILEWYGYDLTRIVAGKGQSR